MILNFKPLMGFAIKKSSDMYVYFLKKRRLFIVFLVIGFFTACEDIVEVPDISNEEVVLVAPLEGSTVNQDLVSFTWNQVYEATEYKVQVATPNFENAAQVVVDTLVKVDSTFIGTRISKTLVNASYEWRVQALNSGYTTGYSISSFSVDAPDKPVTPEALTKQE